MSSSGTPRIRSVNWNVTGEKKAFTVTFASNAAGDGPISGSFDGILRTYNPDTGASPATSAQIMYDEIYSPLSGTYSGSVTGGAFSLHRIDGKEILPAYWASGDSTQSATLSGKMFAERVLSNATTATQGLPVTSTDGFGVNPSLLVDDRTKTVTVKVQLSNFTGSSKTARWRIWWFTTGLGWAVDAEVGTRTITDTGVGTAPFTNDTISITSMGAERVAVELVDDGAAGDLANCDVNAWCVNSH